MKKVLLIYILLFNCIYPQIVFTPSSSGVYDFLERLSLKRIIYLTDEVKPFSRNYITKKLKEIYSQQTALNMIERQELEFYKKEYAYESGENAERWFLYGYSDSLFRLRVSPVLGYGISGTGGSSGHTRWGGVNVYGSYGKSIGAFFEFKDVGEFGQNIDKEKLVTPAAGHFKILVSNGIEFSDVRGGISYDFGWGGISLIKDYNWWGHSRYGSLILSDKAASFPQVRLTLNPLSWLRFSYVHGWLNSLVYDSSSFQYNNLENQRPFLRKEYVDKYFAGNFLTVSPFRWLDVSLGNSFVYSGSIRPEMFIPFMYYKVMDHNTGRGNIDDGNGQIFFDIAVKYPRTFQFYSSLLIDVLEVREILKGNMYTSWFGYSAGFRKADLLIDNLSVSLEYSKTNPNVYENKDETVTYKHLNYPLGHWMGQNADHLRLQFDYVLMRGLKLAVYGERLRKGGLRDISEVYDEPVYTPFLFGDVRKDFRYGINAGYEPVHDLFIRAEYEYSDVSDEDISRTPEFMFGKKHSYLLMITYGL